MPVSSEGRVEHQKLNQWRFLFLLYIKWPIFGIFCAGFTPPFFCPNGLVFFCFRAVFLFSRHHSRASFTERTLQRSGLLVWKSIFQILFFKSHYYDGHFSNTFQNIWYFCQSYTKMMVISYQITLFMRSKRYMLIFLNTIIVNY